MTVNPHVEITEITRDEIEQIKAGQPPKGLFLGERHAWLCSYFTKHYNELCQRLTRYPETRLFLLAWHGNKVPRGVIIIGYKVVWTQNGIINSSDGVIGTYDRLIEFGGPTETEQVMLCYIYKKPKDVTTQGEG